MAAAGALHTIPDQPFVVVLLLVVVSLTNTNYQQWRRQVEAILNGLNLLPYLTDNPPWETLYSDATPPVETPNPKYKTWIRQDALIYGAILPTLSESVSTLVTNTTTTASGPSSKTHLLVQLVGSSSPSKNASDPSRRVPCQ